MQFLSKRFGVVFAFSSWYAKHSASLLLVPWRPRCISQLCRKVTVPPECCVLSCSFGFPFSPPVKRRFPKTLRACCCVCAQVAISKRIQSPVRVLCVAVPVRSYRHNLPEVQLRSTLFICVTHSVIGITAAFLSLKLCCWLITLHLFNKSRNKKLHVVRDSWTPLKYILCTLRNLQ
jgi:hypothetical protein